MACSNCGIGTFIPIDSQSGVGTTLANGTKLTYSDPGSLAVQKGNGPPQLFTAGSGGKVHYFTWGNNFLVILTVEGGVGGTRTLTRIDTAKLSLPVTNIDNIPGSSTVDLPEVHICPGDGSMFFAKFTDGSTAKGSIWPSDTGGVICFAIPFTLTMQFIAEATATEFRIMHGGTVQDANKRPLADCAVSPKPRLDFDDAVIGPGVPAAMATHTEVATIKNNGNNCFTVNSIATVAPFTPIGFSAVTLQPGEKVNVTIQFAPAALGTFDEQLLISPAPPKGDTFIRCRGKARMPKHTISYNSNILFKPPTPLMTTAHQNLAIQNTGEVDITVNIPAPVPGSPFQWAPGSHVLTPGGAGNKVNIDISFTPTTAGTTDSSFSFTSNATGSPHMVTLQGTGCVPHAEIEPGTGPIAMGEVQQGFRTVRSFRVRNTGNAPLQFSARIVPVIPGDQASVDAAALFGLQQTPDTPVTSPLASFANQMVNPSEACGAVTLGTGDFDFGVTFFAGAAPSTANAKLEIYDHNDTRPGIAPTFTIDLTAVIINPVSVDVMLVLDRSGSMGESSGARLKIETARDAARLFIQLCRPNVEDRIGLVRFNTIPEVVRNIELITAGNQEAIVNDINPTNFSDEGGTAIAGGVIKALENMAMNPRSKKPDKLNKVILVLTDGYDNTPYLNPADNINYTLIGGDFTLPGPLPLSIDTSHVPVPMDTKVYAVAIGDSVDAGRLEAFSLPTGGDYLHAQEFSGFGFFQLEKHFTQVYMRAMEYMQISDPEFDIMPGETHNFEFDVLAGDKSAMIVIYDQLARLPFFVTSPSGETVDLLSFPADFSVRPGIAATARFLEINFPQGQPERYAGKWKVQLKHNGESCTHRGGGLFNAQEFGPGFVPKQCKPSGDPIHYGIALGVISNFAMMAYVTPGTVHVGEPIQLTAVLSEYGLPATGCTVTVHAVKPDGTESMHTLYDDGAHGDDGSNDGTYGFAYIHTQQEGSYTFTFTATGYAHDKTPIKRETVRSKYVEGIQPLIPTHKPGTMKPGSDKCCTIISTLVWVGLVFLFLIWLALIFIWIKI